MMVKKWKISYYCWKKMSSGLVTLDISTTVTHTTEYTFAIWWFVGRPVASP